MLVGKEPKTFVREMISNLKFIDFEYKFGSLFYKRKFLVMVIKPFICFIN